MIKYNFSLQIVFSALLAMAAAQFFNQPGRRPPLPPPPKPVAINRPIAPPNRGSEANAQIIRYENTINPDGSYNYA